MHAASTAIVGAVAAVVLGHACAWWFRRAPHPLLDLGALRNQAFRVGNVGGGVYRMVISAVPFLLPLMFQSASAGARSAPAVGAVVFAGNVAIKPATSPLLRRFGFRPVLIGSVLGRRACMFVAIALCSPATPLPVVGAVLVLSGAAPLGRVQRATTRSQFAEIRTGSR